MILSEKIMILIKSVVVAAHQHSIVKFD